MMTPRATQTSGRRRAHKSCTALGSSFEPGTRTRTMRRAFTPAARSAATTRRSNTPASRGLKRAATMPTVKAAPSMADERGAWRLMTFWIFASRSQRHLLHDLEAVAVETDDFAGAVGEETYPAQTEGAQDLRADTVV